MAASRHLDEEFARSEAEVQEGLRLFGVAAVTENPVDDGTVCLDEPFVSRFDLAPRQVVIRVMSFEFVERRRRSERGDAASTALHDMTFPRQPANRFHRGQSPAGLAEFQA